MPAKTYRFRYSADNKEFEVEGDRAFVIAMIKRYGPDATLNPTPIHSKGKSGKGVPLPDQPAPKDVSLREFIQKLNFKKHTDIVLAFGYYLEKFRGNRDFTSVDVNNCYYEAKLEPSNSSQMIANNIKTGRMMEAKAPEKSKKRGFHYTVTASGEKFIAERITAPE